MQSELARESPCQLAPLTSGHPLPVWALARGPGHHPQWTKWLEGRLGRTFEGSCQWRSCQTQPLCGPN